MSFTDMVGTIFDEADEIDIRQEEDSYNHARVRGFDPSSTDRYEKQLEERGLNYDFNETAFGPEFEIWEGHDRKI